MIDARGLACPMPVLMTQKEIAKNSQCISSGFFKLNRTSIGTKEFIFISSSDGFPCDLCTFISWCNSKIRCFQ